MQVLCVAPVSSFGSFHMLAVFFRVSMLMIPLLLVQILDTLVRLQFLDTACKLLTSQCFHHIVWKIQPVPWDKVGMTCAM